MLSPISLVCFFFFNDTATTEIYTLSLHDALPILHLAEIAFGATARVDLCRATSRSREGQLLAVKRLHPHIAEDPGLDRKSTRLNSSHQIISYAVFCLKKKNSTHCGYGCDFARPTT